MQNEHSQGSKLVLEASVIETIDVFYQGHGIQGIEHIEISPDHTFAMLKEVLINRHSCEADTLLFLEDQETPLEDHYTFRQHCLMVVAKVHLHRCRHIQVNVNFAGRSVHHQFSPSATVARIEHWAAVKKFGLTEADACEHSLQIAGSQERPTPGTHIGTLSHCPNCRVDFDLVPEERINGAPW